MVGLQQQHTHLEGWPWFSIGLDHHLDPPYCKIYYADQVRPITQVKNDIHLR
jgi:hypothetical protein